MISTWKYGESDVYLYDLSIQKLTNLTNDIFSDSEPAWSPDGKKIAFISDREKNKLKMEDIDGRSHDDIKMFTHKFSQTDIYIIDVQTKIIQRITHTDYNENYPIWMHSDDVLFYTADYNGVWNVFRHNLESDIKTPITNILTGIQQLSLSKDDRMMVFSGFSKGGWDINRVTNPGGLSKKEVPLTNYFLNKDQDESLTDLRWHKTKRTKS